MDLYLYEDILKAQSQDELLEKTQRVVEKLEYETFMYGFRYPDTSGRENRLVDCIFGTYPESWCKRYIDMEYESIDPAVAHCMTGNTPVIWTHRYFSAPRVADMHHECADAGVAGGATFPAHGNWPTGGAGLLSLARDEDTDKSVPHTLETLGAGMLLTGYVHEAVRRIGFADSAVGAVKLTPRERECLLHSARGRTMADIAKTLIITHNTVVFHLTNACRKLGAANRTEAVAIAVSRGMLQP